MRKGPECVPGRRLPASPPAPESHGGFAFAWLRRKKAVDGLHAPVRGPRRAAAAGYWHPAAKCAAAPARATSAITSAAISHPRQAARARRSSSSVVFISSSSVLSFVPLRSTCAAQVETSQFFLLSVQHAQFLSSFQPSGRYTPGPSYSQTGLDLVCDAQLWSSLRYSARDFTSMESLISSFTMYSFLLWFFKRRNAPALPPGRVPALTELSFLPCRHGRWTRSSGPGPSRVFGLTPADWRFPCRGNGRACAPARRNTRG